MANGVVVCPCKRIHWNNATALRELYELIGQQRVTTIDGYAKLKREQGQFIYHGLANRRFMMLQRLGLINLHKGKWVKTSQPY